MLTAMLVYTGATGKRIVALDFDGVVCDSVGESSLSAIKVKQPLHGIITGPIRLACAACQTLDVGRFHLMAARQGTAMQQHAILHMHVVLRSRRAWQTPGHPK